MPVPAVLPSNFGFTSGIQVYFWTQRFGSFRCRFGTSGTQRGERHGVEPLAKWQNIIAGIKYNSAEWRFGQVGGKPLEMPEVLLPDAPAGLDFNAEDLLPPIRHDKIDFALIFVPVVA